MLNRTMNAYGTGRKPKADEVWLSKEDSEYVVANLKPGELYKVTLDHIICSIK